MIRAALRHENYQVFFQTFPGAQPLVELRSNLGRLQSKSAPSKSDYELTQESLGFVLAARATTWQLYIYPSHNLSPLSQLTHTTSQVLTTVSRSLTVNENF